MNDPDLEIKTKTKVFEMQCLRLRNCGFCSLMQTFSYCKSFRSFSQFSVRCKKEWVSINSSAGGDPIILCGSKLPQPIELPGGNITVTHHFLPHLFPVSSFLLNYARGMTAWHVPPACSSSSFLQLLSKCSLYPLPFVQIHMKAIAQNHLLDATGVAAFPSPGAVMGRWSVSMKNLMTTMNWVVTVLVEGFFRPFMGPSPLQVVRVKVSPVFGLWILRTPGRWDWNCKSWR